LIAIDLADPDLAAGPPPAHLLPSFWLSAVLVPLASAALLQAETADLTPATRALQQRVESVTQAARRRSAEQERLATRQREVAAAIGLRQAFAGRVDLLHGVLSRVPAAVRFEEVDLSGDEFVISGSATSAALVAAWLEGVDGRYPVAWSAPELRQTVAPTRVRFTIRGRAAGSAR